jgi:nucleotide-binding universal stress UspA family protein
MRTILIPTDYSEAARNAVHYAAELGKATGSKLVLFHAYHVPLRAMVSSGSSAAAHLPATGEELEAEEVKKLRNYTEAVKSLYPGVPMGQVVKAGFAVEEIVDYANNNEIDLIVMGTGAESSHNDVFGSLTTTIINESKRPVLVVPEGAAFKSDARVALAYDCSGVKDASILDMLARLVKTFSTDLMIVDVLKRGEDARMEVDDTMKRFTGQVDHSFHFPVGDHAADTVLHFIDENKVDMLAVIPHKHGFFNRMVRSSFTKKVALHTHVPLLTLPG